MATPKPRYAGPLRDQPLAIELHNTLYADGGALRDGLADADGMRAWLAAVDGLLPVAARAIDGRRLAALRALREAVRAALRATLAGSAIPRGARRALNDASAASAAALQLRADGMRAIRHTGRDAATTAFAAIAADAIALVTGPRAADLRACGAPGCVLVFLRDDPRRRWCSDGCGNRARQARHYARHRP